MDNYEILKDKKYYEILKSKINEKHGRIWKKIAGRPYIGNCSYLYKQLKPIDYQDFFTKYINYISPHKIDSLKKSEFYGRTINDLLILAEEYRKLTNDYSFTLEEYFDDIVNHTIIETFDGHKVETYIANILIEKGFSVNEENGEMDAVLGVDLTVRWKNKLMSYLQIKPISTFIGNNNPSLIDDRVNFYKKQKKLDEYVLDKIKKGDMTVIQKPIEYMLYDKNTFNKNGDIKWYYKNNTPRYKIEELCDDKGISKISLKDFELKYLEY